MVGESSTSGRGGNCGVAVWVGVLVGNGVSVAVGMRVSVGGVVAVGSTVFVGVLVIADVGDSVIVGIGVSVAKNVLSGARVICATTSPAAPLVGIEVICAKAVSDVGDGVAVTTRGVLAGARQLVSSINKHAHKTMLRLQPLRPE